VIPAKRPGLLGTDSGHQAQDHVGTQPGTLGRLQHGSGLRGGERLARPARLALRRVDQRGHIVRDMAVSLCMARGPGQRVMRELHRPAGIARRQPHQCPAHVVRGQLPQLDAPDDRSNQLEDAGCGRASPREPFTCGNPGPMWPDVARRLPALAPNLAPGKLVSNANAGRPDRLPARPETGSDDFPRPSPRSTRPSPAYTSPGTPRTAVR
jgi:hypothetical protein